jgi:hypothetical protein
MTNDEVEAVATAIANARRSAQSSAPKQSSMGVSQHHRDLARLAIETLERYRAARDRKKDDPLPDDPGYSAATGSCKG